MSAAGGSQLVITCLVCEEKIRTWRGDIRVECRCGAEYHARTKQLVEEPICGLLSAEAGAFGGVGQVRAAGASVRVAGAIDLSS